MIKKAKKNGDMETCIHVGILDFIQTKSPGFHHCIMLRDEKTGEVYSSKFIFHVIELKKLKDTPEKEQDELYRWAQLIAAESWETVCEQAAGNPYMEEVKEEMRKISQDEMQRYIYLREAMAVSDEKSRMVSARNAGIKEGIKEGVRVLIKICSNSGIEKEIVQKQIEQEYQISAEEAQAYIQEYWK